MRKTINLEVYGWNDRMEKNFLAHRKDHLVPGRIGSVHTDLFEVFTEKGRHIGRLTGRMLYSMETEEGGNLVTGDWVACRIIENADFILIEQLLPRKNSFKRQEAGQKTRAQGIASNIDTVFICTGLDQDFNIHRIERYLILAWESNIYPVVLLTKADLSDDAEDKKSQVELACPGVPVHTLSALHDREFDSLEPYLQKGKTITLIGSSGSGKSTLINRLMGKNVQATQAVRSSDGRGRHTTTTRSFHLLPDKAVLMDNPGLREVQLWDYGDSDQGNPFRDIEKLTEECKFTDCSHQNEPGCAIQKAIMLNELTESRFKEYQAFREEIQLTKARRIARKRSWEKEISKFARQLKKERKKQRD